MSIKIVKYANECRILIINIKCIDVLAGLLGNLSGRLRAHGFVDYTQDRGEHEAPVQQQNAAIYGQSCE